LNSRFYLDDENYLQTDNTYILFCSKSNNEYFFTEKGYSILNLSAKEDLLVILNAYKSNPELFSDISKNELFNIYSKLKTEDMKKRLLADLSELISDKDEKFLETGITSSDKIYKCFAVKKAGELGIAKFHTNIINMVNNEKDNDIIFTSLVSIGKYSDINNKDLFLFYLKNSDQGLRRVSIEALGKIINEEIVSEMISSFETEKDFGNRIAMIEVFASLKNNEFVNNVLSKLKKTEANSFVSTFIEKRMRK